jgi:hypothetical protein
MGIFTCTATIRCFRRRLQAAGRGYLLACPSGKRGGGGSANGSRGPAVGFHQTRLRTKKNIAPMVEIKKT